MEYTIQALVVVVQALPVGTNLALLHLLWAMLNGSFVQSRGAIFPALQTSGFAVAEIRRSWAALRYGDWNIDQMLSTWRAYVLSQGHWQVRQQEGYRPVAVDLTGFWRPRLKGWLGKHFHALARRALPAVVFGIVVYVGVIGQQRIPLPKAFIRTRSAGMGEAELKVEVLHQVGRTLTPDEVAVLDAGFPIGALQAAAVAQYVVRLATNCTARRNRLPEYQGRGRRPEYGERIRPLPRTHKGKQIAASAPDWTRRFAQEGRTLTVHGWDDVVLPNVKVCAQAQTFQIVVFCDPCYDEPLVLGTTLPVRPSTDSAQEGVGQAESDPAARTPVQPSTILRLYRERWPVEQVPLAAKQMVGLQRQFVFAPAACYRLPELALLAGAILTYLAAVLPAVPTGFWDRHPQPTPGRLRRVLAGAAFPEGFPGHEQLRKKRSVSHHLPKGIAGHRRQKRAA